MTTYDVIFQWVQGIDVGPTGGTATLRTQTVGDYSVLLSYGVPIAARWNKGESIFVDCFSQWSTTTSGHQTAAYNAAKTVARKIVHRVELENLNGNGYPIGVKLTDRTPAKQRRRPIGSTL